MELLIWMIFMELAVYMTPDHLPATVTALLIAGIAVCAAPAAYAAADRGLTNSAPFWNTIMVMGVMALLPSSVTRYTEALDKIFKDSPEPIQMALSGSLFIVAPFVIYLTPILRVLQRT